MNAHTPGPWTHHAEDNIITDSTGRMLIEWQARSLSVPVATRDANACLIAAAPELLDALAEAIEDFAHGYAPDHPFLVKMRALYAKAAGGAA